MKVKFQIKKIATNGKDLIIWVPRAYVPQLEPIREKTFEVALKTIEAEG